MFEEELRTQLQHRREELTAELDRHASMREERRRIEAALSALGPSDGRRPNRPARKPRTRKRPSARAKLPARDAQARTRNTNQRSGTLKARALGALHATEPRTAGQLAEQLAANPRSVSVVLTRAAKAGEARKAARGYLALAKSSG